MWTALSRHRYLRNFLAKSFLRGNKNPAHHVFDGTKDFHCTEEVKRRGSVTKEPVQTNGGCVGHGFAWLLASILIMGVTFLIVFGCYWLSQLVR